MCVRLSYDYGPARIDCCQTAADGPIDRRRLVRPRPAKEEEYNRLAF